MGGTHVVVGATGLLGAALMRALAHQKLAAVAAPRSGPGAVDLSAPNQMPAALASLKPAYVYCAAAISSVEACQARPDETAALNVAGSLALARACTELGVPMVFFSSEYVFDDAVTAPRQEADAPAPLNEYGRQKLAVERGLAAVDGAHLVVRTSGLFGQEPRRKNAVLQLVDAAREGRRVQVATDQLITPTWVDGLAPAAVAAVQQNQRGILHLAGPHVMPRMRFALNACQVLGLPPATVAPRTTDQMGLLAPRPRHAGLSTWHAAHLGLGVPAAAVGLEQMRGWLLEQAR